MAYGSSATDRLAAVRDAINSCLTAQSYSVQGRAKAMANLGELRRLEKDLIEDAATEADGGSMCSLGQMTRLI